ncbi:hypothetical protein D3C78_966400 [compost metagenome]
MFTDFHSGYTASNTVVIAIDRTHQIVILILNRASLDRYFSTKFLEAFWQLFRPEYSQVWFRCRSKVVKCVQETEAVLSYTSYTLYGHTADRFSYPSRVTTEQIIIFRCTKELHDTKLHNEMVNELLSTFFSKCSFSQVTFDVSIKE